MITKVNQQTPQTLRGGSRVQFITIILLELLLLEGINCWTYHYSLENMPWENARKYCRKYFTDMVAIQNAHEIKFLNEKLPFAQFYYWIGIRKINDIWTWVGTGKSLTKEAENWAKGEPNNAGKTGDEDCVEMYIKRSADTGMWNDINCDRQKIPLCYTASCSPLSCGGNGECIETIGNYTCNCNDGFYGPECEHVIQCAALSASAQATMLCTHPNGNFSYNSTCEFHCATGFTLQGSQSLQCNATAMWTAEKPSCEAVNCSSLVIPEQGLMSCSHPLGDSSYNSICDFSCAKGFELRGSDSLECGASGEWSAPTPHCEAVQCVNLKEQEHVIMTCSKPFAPFSYNSTCDFSCAKGFELKGSESLECGASGEWSALTPHCEAVQCVNLKEQEHVIMTCSKPFAPFSYNSTCDFSCAKGFELKGSESLECGASGEWSALTPHCEAVQCVNLKEQEHVIMTCSKPFAPFSYNSTCDFSCAKGFELKGSESLECGASGEWSALTPHCEAVQCVNLKEQEHVIMTCSKPFAPFSYNSTCDFSCAKGFELKGSESLECGASGEWSALTPHCEAVQCVNLKEQEHVIMTCSKPFAPFSYNSTCDFSCAKGFELKGSESLECGASGEWSALTPHCEAVQCQNPEKQDQMIMTCSEPMAPFSYNSTCEFSCPDGFALSGASRIKCAATGQWTAPVPTCQALLCNVLKAPEQAKMNCIHPIDKFTYSSMCFFSCSEGFVLKGSKKLECGVTGQWTAHTPTCEAVKCDVLRAPENGNITCSHPTENFSYLSVCKFGCGKDFSLNGSRTLQCNSLGQWSMTIPTCEDSKPQPISENYTPILTASVVASGISAVTVIAWIVRQLRKKAQGKKFSLLSHEAHHESGTYKINEEV
ncbi:P-selectin-like [Narcine bancroftii]|uniref:P-selectin-like n=1 Tax=Narcine bancroftii TaxID=1343680 RepID=UPI003831F483